ncbi:MAG: hypothetical protein PHU85_03145 [Phycisphaerae bacterium]|nr:hypothetical protein [Phycisphaerae bacterium]
MFDCDDIQDADEPGEPAAHVNGEARRAFLAHLRDLQAGPPRAVSAREFYRLARAMLGETPLPDGIRGFRWIVAGKPCPECGGVLFCLDDGNDRTPPEPGEIHLCAPCVMAVLSAAAPGATPHGRHASESESDKE